MIHGRHAVCDQNRSSVLYFVLSAPTSALLGTSTVHRTLRLTPELRPMLTYCPLHTVHRGLSPISKPKIQPASLTRADRYQLPPSRQPMRVYKSQVVVGDSGQCTARPPRRIDPECLHRLAQKGWAADGSIGSGSHRVLRTGTERLTSGPECQARSLCGQPSGMLKERDGSRHAVRTGVCYSHGGHRRVAGCRLIIRAGLEG